MHDALLELARHDSVQVADCVDLVVTLLYVSDGVYVADLGGVGIGDPRMTVHLDVTETFIPNGGDVTVEWLLISTASESTVVAEVIGSTYNVHWRSGPTAGASYVIGRRMFTVPLPPTRSLKPYLCVVGLFTDAGTPLDGLGEGRVNIRIAGSPDNAPINPFPNAI